MHRTVSTLALLWLAALVAGAQEPAKKMAQLAPKDTVVLATFPDLSQSCKAVRESNVCKMFAETELKELCDSIKTSLKGPLGQVEGKLKEAVGLSFEQVCGFLKGEVAIALLDIDPNRNHPKVLLRWSYGDQEAALDMLLAKGAEALGAPTTHEVAGVKVVTLGGGEGMRGFYYAKVDGALLASLDKGVVDEALTRRAGDGADALAAHPAVVAAIEATGAKTEGTTHFGLFVNMEPVWALAEKAAPPEARTAIAELGLRDIAAIGYASRSVGGQFDDVLHIQTTAEPRGLVRWLSPGTLDEGAHLDRIPKKAIAYSSSRGDLAGMYKDVHALVKAVDREAYGRMTEQLAQVEAKLELKLDAFLATIGTHCVSHSTMPERGLLPHGIIELELADAKGFVDGVGKIAKAIGCELVTREYQGKTVYHVRSALGQLGQNPFDRMGRDPAMFVQVMTWFLPTHFTIDGSWAVFGSLHQHVLEHMDVPADAKGIDAAVPAGTSLIQVANVTPILLGAYDTMLPLSGMLEGALRTFGVDFDARLLPRTQTLAKHLSHPSMIHVRRDAKGVIVRFRGDLGMMPIAGAGAAGMGAAGFLAMRSGGSAPPHPMPVEPEARSAEATPAAPATKGVGEDAPDFTLKTASGEDVTLSKLRGQVVVIDFWATWCGPCKEVMPAIEKVAQQFKGKKVAIYGVNVWDEREKAIEMMKEKAYTYGLLLGGDEVATAYGVSGIPTMFVIGPTGKIVLAKVGSDGEAGTALAEAIEKALADTDK